VHAKRTEHCAFLESACEKDWEEWQRLLQESSDAAHEVVQQSFQELWVRGQQYFENIKRELEGMRSH